MSIRFFTITFIIFLVSVPKMYGQLDQKGRFEIKLSHAAQKFHLANLENKGTLVAFEGHHEKNGEELWEFVRIDTAFNITWKRNLFVEKNYSIVNHEVIGEEVYFILIDLMNWRETLILRMSPIGEFTAFRFKNLIPMSIIEFRVIDQGRKLLVGGYFNYRPIVVMYELDTNIPRILPGLLNYIGDLVQLETSEDFRRIDLLVGYSSNKINRNSLLLSYDFEGNLLESTVIELGDRLTVKHGKVRRFSKNDIIFGGVYGKKASDYSSGIIVTYIHEGKIQFSNTTGYAKMDNFFNYMRPRRRKRVKERIARKQENGKEANFFFRTKINEVEVLSNSIFVSGESFYINYSDYSRYYYGISSSTMRVFDGYEYTHGFIVAINPEGKVLYNYSMGIDDLKKYNLDQVTFSLPEENEKKFLFYANKHDLSFGVFSRDTSEFYMEPIQLKYPNDRLRPTHSLSMAIENWYDNNYMIFGKQQIRNGMDKGVDYNRNVFFINKIQYSY